MYAARDGSKWSRRLIRDDAVISLTIGTGRRSSVLVNRHWEIENQGEKEKTNRILYGVLIEIKSRRICWYISKFRFDLN